MVVLIGIAAAVIIAGLVWVFVFANGARTRGKTFEAKTNQTSTSRPQAESPCASGLD